MNNQQISLPAMKSDQFPFGQNCRCDMKCLQCMQQTKIKYSCNVFQRFNQTAIHRSLIIFFELITFFFHPIYQKDEFDKDNKTNQKTFQGIYNHFLLPGSQESLTCIQISFLIIAGGWHNHKIYCHLINSVINSCCMYMSSMICRELAIIIFERNLLYKVRSLKGSNILIFFPGNQICTPFAIFDDTHTGRPV